MDSGNDPGKWISKGNTYVPDENDVEHLFLFRDKHNGFESSGFENNGFENSGFENSGLECNDGNDGNGFEDNGSEGNGFESNGFVEDNEDDDNGLEDGDDSIGEKLSGFERLRKLIFLEVISDLVYSVVPKTINKFIMKN